MSNIALHPIKFEQLVEWCYRAKDHAEFATILRQYHLQVLTINQLKFFTFNKNNVFKLIIF